MQNEEISAQEHLFSITDALQYYVAWDLHGTNKKPVPDLRMHSSEFSSPVCKV